MRTPLFTTLNRYLRQARRWYETTPERALDQAYDAALMIKAIEDEHFEGQRISRQSSKYSQNALECFQTDLRKYLKIAELRLSEFKVSRGFFNSTDFSANARSQAAGTWSREQATEIFEKLKFIDQVLDRYRLLNSTSVSLVPLTQPDAQIGPPIGGQPIQTDSERLDSEADGILEKTGVLPRSIVGTLSRIKRDLDPNSEQQVVQNFRNTKAKTLISIRFLLLLIILPLLAQQLSKTLLIGPVIDHLRQPSEDNIFLNFELEEAALRELQTYKERLEFDSLLPKALALPAPKLPDSPARQLPTEPEEESETPQEKQLERPEAETTPSAAKDERLLLAEKVKELAKDYYKEGSNAIKNVFADAFALLAFGLVIVTNRREVAVLKTFIDETVYGLSDSAKAFIIILFTDIFVGFHSPHGWEVLLEGVAKHFGLPASRDFIFLFIATFPVILDTIFKYWIFRYLNRISPSAVATYRNMNE